MNKTFKTTFIFLVFLITSQMVFAGDVFISQELPKTNDLKVDDQILVNINLNSQGTEYNAVEGVLNIPKIFEIEKVVTGNSFISVWLENPVNFSNSIVEFSGIAPAGYNKETGLIFSIVLKVKDAGFGNLELENLGLFENDGLGTRENIREKKLSFNTRSRGSDEDPYLISVKDTTPPEEFEIKIIKDQNLSDGLYTLVFSAIDKGSGVKSYDVFEGRHVFKQENSPYVLENQRLNGKIKVVATDHEGNGQTAEITPPGKVCVGASCFGAGFVIGLVVIVVLVILWRKLKK